MLCHLLFFHPFEEVLEVFFWIRGANYLVFHIWICFSCFLWSQHWGYCSCNMCGQTTDSWDVLWCRGGGSCQSKVFTTLDHPTSLPPALVLMLLGMYYSLVQIVSCPISHMCLQQCQPGWELPPEHLPGQPSHPDPVPVSAVGCNGLRWPIAKPSSYVYHCELTP